MLIVRNIPKSGGNGRWRRIVTVNRQMESSDRQKASPDRQTESSDREKRLPDRKVGRLDLKPRDTMGENKQREHVFHRHPRRRARLATLEVSAFTLIEDATYRVPNALIPHLANL